MHFLDLKLKIHEGGILTSTFFKPTDRNGYVPITSCHHSNWLKAIPKGQFIRLRRNCTRIADYYQQAELLKIRFLQKGYNKKKLEEAIEEVGAMERSTLLQPKQRVIPANNKAEFSLITGFNIQHRQIEQILRKHWHILQEDKVLGPVLPPRPHVIYRKAANLATKLTSSAIDEPKTIKIPDLKGFFRCGRCFGCKHTCPTERKSTTFKSNQTNLTYKWKDTITCNTTGVVYMLDCPCGLQYIGRTIRNLKTRIYEHVYNIKRGLETHSVSLHFKEAHNSDPKFLRFWGIDQVKPNWRGALKIRALSKLESKWIYSMQTLNPRGLNVEFDLNCFLDNS